MNRTPRPKWKKDQVRITVVVEVAYDPERTDLHEVIPLIERDFSNCNHRVADRYEFRGRAAYFEGRNQS